MGFHGRDGPVLAASIAGGHPIYTSSAGYGAAFAPDWLDAGAPAFVEGDEGPGDSGREVAEDGLGGGVDVECGGDEVEVRGLGAEAGAGEVAVLLEVSEAGGGVHIAEVVLADADPVVEALEREVEVL